MLDQSVTGHEPGELLRARCQRVCNGRRILRIRGVGPPRHSHRHRRIRRWRGIEYRRRSCLRILIHPQNLEERQVPVIPVFNTYYPPNQPTPARCYDFGVALRAAIESAPTDDLHHAGVFGSVDEFLARCSTQ